MKNLNRAGITQLTTKETLQKRGKRLVDYLMSLYPSFATECKSETKWKASVITWNLAIKDLTDSEISRACESCRNANEQFIPSIGRFRHKAKGLLDVEQAFAMALTKDYSNELVKEAVARIDSYSWKRDNERTLRAKFSAVYSKICDEVLDGTFGQDKRTQKSGRMSAEDFDKYLDRIWPLTPDLSQSVREYHKVRRDIMCEINNLEISGKENAETPYYNERA